MSVWSNTPPTEPGWYWIGWLRRSPSAPPELIAPCELLACGEPRVLVAGFYMNVSEVVIWGPRIQPPPLPEPEETT
jgi:hypothetical protein